MSDLVNNVLGSGWDYPYEAPTGVVQTADGTESVEAAVSMVFATPRGARFMLPEYGSDLHSLLFEPADVETAAIAELYAYEAIARWVPRVENVKVRTDIRPDDHLINIQIAYSYRGSPTRRMMIYPFYLQPEQ